MNITKKLNKYYKNIKGLLNVKVPFLFCTTLLFCGINQSWAEQPDPIKQFLNTQFIDSIPKSQRLWINEEKQKQIGSEINPSQQKISYRYWQQDNKTVWILNEIGKERDITTGIIIDNNIVQKVEVLIYRESRGGQVQNQRFTQQYFQKDSQSNLIKEIDSISGATLSVNALNKQVSLALLLNSFVLATEVETTIKE